jgi:hypothetical protein
LARTTAALVRNHSNHSEFLSERGEELNERRLSHHCSLDQKPIDIHSIAVERFTFALITQIFIVYDGI